VVNPINLLGFPNGGNNPTLIFPLCDHIPLLALPLVLQVLQIHHHLALVWVSAVPYTHSTARIAFKPKAPHACAMNSSVAMSIMAGSRHFRGI
jgi:hypothetical protein